MMYDSFEKNVIVILFVTKINGIGTNFKRKIRQKIIYYYLIKTIFN